MKNDKGYDIVTVIGVAASVIALALILIFRPGMAKNNASEPEVSADGQENVQTVPDNGSGNALPEGTVEKVESAVPSAVSDSQLYADVSTPRILPHEILDTILSAFGKKETGSDEAASANADVKFWVNTENGGVDKVELASYYESVPKNGEVPRPVVLGDFEYPFLALTSTHAGFALKYREDFMASYDLKSFSLTRSSEDGRLRVRELWTVKDECPGEIKYSVTFENLSEHELLVQGFKLEGSAMPTSVTPDRKAGRGESSGGLSISSNGKTKDYNLKNLSKLDDVKKGRLASEPAAWAAVHSKYFVMAFWPDEGNFSGMECAAVKSAKRPGVEQTDNARYHMRAILPSFELPANGSSTINVTGYAGPKMFDRLYDYGNGLVSVMEMDRFFFWRPAWMRIISRCLLKMLVYISQCFPKNLGSGLAVIILTIIVKVLFWPLSHKSTVSMRKMQALKPQLDEMRAKYKDDPQTMYRKQQELFKKNNVSQLGGCLPMLLQIPVFFALFNTFRNAIEMRHASFLWAYDLSMPDTLSFSPDSFPIRPLALLMGVTMYFQQKMTPNPDPQQAKMMNFMTIFFVFLFYGMPSALTLYLSISYLLGILQTMLTNKMLPSVVLADGAAKNKK